MNLSKWVVKLLNYIQLVNIFLKRNIFPFKKQIGNFYGGNGVFFSVDWKKFF
jgi:hypothetical protein